MWEHDTEAQRAARKTALSEFLENLADSDYSLCVRGVGNYSPRFYETMAAGRIPLFLDTDCVLPFDGMIDWRQEIPWVAWDDRARIAETLVAFHCGQTAVSFAERQARLRTLWEEWLSPDGFFRNFHHHFRPGSDILSQLS